MLVLSRKLNQDVVLNTSDGPIRVKVTRISDRGNIRLSFDAPQAVKIHRGEIEHKVEVAQG